MSIFRKFTLYLALMGIITAFVLVKKINTPDPASNPVELPAVNPYEHTIVASGIIEAVDRNISIGIPQSGLITALFVHVSDQVVDNQPLFQLDDRELQAQLLVQEANIEVATAHLNRLKDQLDRLESIQDSRAISQEELKTKKNDVIIANSQLTAAQAQIQQTLRLIERLTVRAPRGGIVLQSNIRTGEFVSTSSLLPIMILGNLDRLQVRVDIDEQNACKFIPNSSAIAIPKNHASIQIPLNFNHIEPYVIPKKSLTGSSDERVDTRVLQVIFSFQKPDDFPVYVGQQVDVFIDQSSAHQANEELSDKGA